MREEKTPTDLRKIADTAKRIYLQLEEAALNMEKASMPTVLVHISYIDNTIGRCLYTAERINVETKEQIDAKASGIRSSAFTQKQKAVRQRVEKPPAEPAKKRSSPRR
jgi:hypothetical protein